MRLMAFGLIVFLFCSCGSSSSTATDSDTGSVAQKCAVGEDGCACTGGGACDPGLVCASNLCVDIQLSDSDTISSKDSETPPDSDSVSSGNDSDTIDTDSDSKADSATIDSDSVIDSDTIDSDTQDSDTHDCQCNSPGICETAVGATCDAQGVCTYPAATGQSCKDGIACTENDRCQADKSCVGTPYTCDPAEMCFKSEGAICNGDGTCLYPVDAGATCNDGNNCSYNDTCSSMGICRGISYNCNNPGLCETSIGASCDGNGSCNYSADVGADCNDGIACTHSDICLANKSCAGTPYVCDNPGICESAGAGSCNGDGTCNYTAITSCDNSDNCCTFGCFIDASDSDCTSDFTVYDGGAYSTGDWYGYAWTSPGSESGTTITPEGGFSDVSAGDTLCCSGTVAKSNDAVAMMGLAFVESDGYTTYTVTPTENSISFNVSGTISLSDSLLFVVKDINSDEYCASIAIGQTTIYWSDLKQECWNSSSTAYYAGTPISNLIIQMVGHPAQQNIFNICLNDIVEVNQ